MALRAEVINFVRLQLVEKLHKVDRIAEVAVVEEHSNAIHVGISVQVIDARGVKCAGAANDPVNFIALLKQQIGQITAVLTGMPVINARFIVTMGFSLSFVEQQMIYPARLSAPDALATKVDQRCQFAKLEKQIQVL
jgi:hypothetical protein